MALIPLLIDYHPPFLRSARAPVSLLTLPLGARSFLDHLAAGLDDVVDRDLLVMPTFGHGLDYEQAIQTSSSAPVRVTPPEVLGEVLNEYEPWDYLVVVDPGRWPVNGFDLGATVRSCGDHRAASHVVAVGADADGTRERVECDGNGHVKRVQRLYNRANWPEVAATKIFLSVVPARAIGGVSFTSLPELRAALSVKGVLSRDVPVPVDLVNLTEECGFLALNERMLVQALPGRAHADFSKKQEAVLVGRECTVHPSVRLVGPVVLHDHVTVEEGVSIVGPTVVGAGSRVHREATIVQSVLAPGTTVPAGATILHQVASGRCPTSSVDANAHGRRTSATMRSIVMQQHTDGDMSLPFDAMRRRRRVHLILKRVMDVTLSSAALVLLSPLLIIVAILVKLNSRGPVLFIHHREQRDGKDFPCLKFRTMIAGAHRLQRELYKRSEVDGPQFKIRDDPRLTRLGRWLRATNIDELPQLINVFLGHMSLVGARPSPFRENQVCVPWRRARLSIRPGITGLWQLCCKDRSRGDFHQWIYYDMMYVRNLSVLLDIKILLATLLTLAGSFSVPLAWLLPHEGDPHRHIS